MTYKGTHPVVHAVVTDDPYKLPVIGWQTCPGCHVPVCPFQETFAEELPGPEAFSTVVDCEDCQVGRVWVPTGWTYHRDEPPEETGVWETCPCCAGTTVIVLGPDDEEPVQVSLPSWLRY